MASTTPRLRPLTEFELGRACLMLAVHAVMQRARKVIPREGHLDVPNVDYYARDTIGVRRRLRMLLTRDGDHYYVELCAEPHAAPGSRCTMFAAEIVIASRGSAQIGLDLLLLRNELSEAPRGRIHSDLCRVFGVGGELAQRLPTAEPRATFAGEG